MRVAAGKHGRAGRILRQCDRGNGYPCVSLWRRGKWRAVSVHKLVAEAFYGPSFGLEVNHKNGIRSDNRVVNLEYATRSENAQHSYDTGLQSAKGEDNGQAKLNNQAVREIFAMRGQRVSAPTVGHRYGVGASVILDIWNGLLWSHITSEMSGVPERPLTNVQIVEAATSQLNLDLSRSCAGQYERIIQTARLVANLELSRLAVTEALRTLRRGRGLRVHT